jgi:hypothetical protein
MNPNGSEGVLSAEMPAIESTVAADILSDEELDTDTRKETDYPYWICTSASGFRRLHKCGGCNASKIGMANWAYHTVQEVQTSKADAPCLKCWPELKKDEDSSSSEESSSDSSSAELPLVVHLPGLGEEVVEASGSEDY